jgi:hypothetical protein
VKPNEWLALPTIQWIWLTTALKELNVPVTNAAMFCNNKATIDITYNHKMGDPSKRINIAYHLVHENVESRRFLSFRLNRLKIWPISALKDFCSNFMEIEDSHYGYKMTGNVGFWRICSYVVISLLIVILHFIISSSCTERIS